MVLRIATLVLLLASVGTASAATIDLSKPLGNRDGCINRNGQEVQSDDMLLLTDEELVTAASACTFTNKKPGPNGSLILEAQCQDEGESEDSTAVFTVTRKKPGKPTLVVTDEEGNVFGEVAPCH